LVYWSVALREENVFEAYEKKNLGKCQGRREEIKDGWGEEQNEEFQNVQTGYSCMACEMTDRILKRILQKQNVNDWINLAQVWRFPPTL
jgi:hypothetical protein